MAALFITLREGIVFFLILLLLIGVYPERKKYLIVFALTVISAGILTTWFNYPLTGFLKNAYSGFLFYSFVLILFLSFVSGNKPVYPLLCLALSLFIPSAELASQVIDAVMLKGGTVLIFVLAGTLVAVFLFIMGLRTLPGLDLSKYFGRDGVFVFISAILFLFGGVKEFDNSSVVSALQHGLSVFLSSFIPFLNDLLLIPRGETLVTDFGGISGYLASQRTAMAVTALILFLPPLFVFLKLLRTREPDTGGLEKSAERRKALFFYRDELLKKGIPLLLSLSASVILLHLANLAERPTYDPEPSPLVTDGDMLTIPLKDRLGDISDGRMRKYSFLHQGEVYRFMVVMRPDGAVVAALDACEVCPPRGYVQRGGHVICIYCNTPIPLQSIGRAGGCNPIPLRAMVKGDSLLVGKSNVIDAYKEVAGGERGERLK